jgi:DNA-binding FrmR family transcriptional regulator
MLICAMMNQETAKKLKNRLRRIAGQVDGIERMLDEGRYCVDVMMQIEATRAALARVGSIALGEHIRTCVVSAFESHDEDEIGVKTAELLALFERHVAR